jgi:hypothetical protein
MRGDTCDTPEIRQSRNHRELVAVTCVIGLSENAPILQTASLSLGVLNDEGTDVDQRADSKGMFQ